MNRERDLDRRYVCNALNSHEISIKREISLYFHEIGENVI